MRRLDLNLNRVNRFAIRVRFYPFNHTDTKINKKICKSEEMQKITPIINELFL